MLSKETKINLDDTYMNVIQFGSGDKNLVILSGMSLCGLEGKGEGIAAAYARFADDYTVYLFDRKKVLPENYQILDLAEDVYRVLEILGVRKAAVYGISQGGMMAMTLAVHHPELVEGLVVCSTSPYATETAQQVFPKWTELAEKKDVIAINRSFFDLVYSEQYLKTYEAYLPVLEKEGSPEDCVRFSILAQACLNFNIMDSLDQIHCPVLALGDEKDRVFSAEGTKAIARKLGCSSYLYNQYSHAVYDEAADIQEKVFAFLQNI